MGLFGCFSRPLDGVFGAVEKPDSNRSGEVDPGAIPVAVSGYVRREI
jgi:hypothetical protein